MFATVITVLCGGFGGARFARGFVDAGFEVTLVVNTADDLAIFDAHVSPDVDMCLHALAGVLDEDQGWGIIGDTYRAVDGLHGTDRGWFRIGDLDLGFGLSRAAWLAQGMSLSDATDTLARARGVTTTVLPMTDGTVRTVVETPVGLLGLQEFLVLHRGVPRVDAVFQRTQEPAEASTQVLRALRDAEVVVLGPSSPVASVLPILGLGGVREVLRQRTGPTVAVTPVVRSSAPTRRPEMFRFEIRERFLASQGVAHTAEAIAGLYLDIIDGFVGDVRDGLSLEGVRCRGGARVATQLVDTLAPKGHRRAAVALDVVAFGRRIGASVAPSSPSRTSHQRPRSSSQSPEGMDT